MSKKIIEFCQMVARGYPTTWNIPRIRDGDRWRNIHNSDLVMNPDRLNGHDKYEDAIFRIEALLKDKGWTTTLSDLKAPCHEQLYYQHYRLKCLK